MPWTPTNPPAGIDPTLAQWLFDELNRLSIELQVERVQWVPYLALDDPKDLPPRPQYGDVIFVDTTVLPGAQEGLHYWDGSAWSKV